MKKWFQKIAPMCMAMSMTLVSFAVSANCKYWFYQDEMPETAKKLRKF